MIPRILHRVWPGEDEIPEEYDGYWASWKRNHPGWQAITWRPADYLPLRNQREYDDATSYAQRADIARYEILHRHGGVYVDTDFECLRPFDELIDGLEGFAGLEDEEFLCISLMGARPRHPFIDQLIAMVPHSIASQPGLPANQQTGPWLATRVFREGASVFVPPLFKTFPSRFFYPYRYDEAYRRNETFPDAYAVHHWAGSWLGNRSQQRPPQCVRIVLGLDWAQAPGPDPIIERFAELFGPEDPVELAIPLNGADPNWALDRIGRILRACEVDPRRTGKIVLYTDDELPGLVSEATVLRDAADGNGDPAADLRALDALEQQRRRIDAYRELSCSATTA